MCVVCGQRTGSMQLELSCEPVTYVQIYYLDSLALDVTGIHHEPQWRL